MERGATLFGKATFAMDRGYDDNKMFLKLDELGQEYVIRLKSNRRLFYHNKWIKAAELRNRRKSKGKVKTNVIYKGRNHKAYLSHVKVQITTSEKYLSGTCLWHHRTSYDACHEKEIIPKKMLSAWQGPSTWLFWHIYP